MGRALTLKTNLDTLRKDAKRWLKALRAGDGKAQDRLLAAWSKAPAEAGLRDIQHALALEYGCESWMALKAAIEDLALDRKSHAERVDLVMRHGAEGDPAAAWRILRRHPAIARDSLFTAAICGDLAEVERWLERDPQGATRTGGALDRTALGYVAYGRLDAENAVAIARRLLAAGADPNFQFDDGWGNAFTVVTGAIGLGEGARPSHPQAQALVDLLIESGADPYDRQSLYNVSIVGQDVDWYEALWRHCEAHGATGRWRDADEHGLGGDVRLCALDYLLGNAVRQNHLVRAEWLLSRGARADAPHAYGGRPLHALAQVSGFNQMADLLQRHGARPMELTGVHAYRAAALGLDEARARALLESDPALKDDPAPLLAAAELGNAPAVALLLKLGASPARLDPQGISPLHRAVQSGSLPAVDLLLAAGADVNLRENRWRGTPLSWASVMGQAHLVVRLAPLSRDVRPMVRLALIPRLTAVLQDEPALANQRLAGDPAPTPFFCLPDEEDAAIDVARILLAHGADPLARNDEGRTAIDAARARGLEDAADLMEGRSDV